MPFESSTTRPAAARLASAIRRLRQAKELSQQQLSVLAGYTRQYVSLAERVNRNLPSLGLVQALDRCLDADGDLLTLRQQAVAEHHGRRRTVAAPYRFAAGGQADSVIDAPAGRYFAGTTVAATTYPATDDGRIVVSIPQGQGLDPGVLRPGRGVVVGVLTDGNAGPRSFALDRRVVRSRLGRAAPEAPIVIPRAYELDDLGYGLLWATANLDAALLDDDRALSAAEAHLADDSRSDRTVGRLGFTAELSAVSRMHLGSTVCARHILRNVGSLSSPPSYWTREQRGEEASTWLFLAHKYAYLQRTSAMSGSGETVPTRTFCIPHVQVEDSKPAERVLLFLAVSLMESFGLLVDVCTEPEYTALQGFVLDQRRRAIVANWVGQDGIWHVDVTDHKGTLREFADARGYAHAHSVTRGESPVERMHAFADYLDLDWTWLTRRCAELGDYGAAGFLSPRSRLLSTAGVDRACSFVGSLSR